MQKRAKVNTKFKFHYSLNIFLNMNVFTPFAYLTLATGAWGSVVVKALRY